MRRLTLLWSCAVAGGLAVSAYAALIEPQRLTFSFVRVADPRVRTARRYLVLSDLHLRPFSARTYQSIARAAQWAVRSGAHTALLAGDVVDDDREAGAVALRLRRAFGDLEVMYVSGNHEAIGSRAGWPFRRNDANRIRAALERARIRCLDGMVAHTSGVDVIGLGWPRSRATREADRAALLRTSSAPAVVLTHSPDHAFGLPAGHVLIALCGHTHGGQVRLPLIGAPWTPVRARLPRLAGLLRLGGVPVYVSRGIGATIPIRLGAPPEATIVEIGPDRRSSPPPGARRIEVLPRSAGVAGDPAPLLQ